LEKALGDGRGERKELVKKVFELIRSFRTTEQFNPALLNATISALGNALWSSPELVGRLPEIDEKALELLLHISDQTLRNISARLPALVDEVRTNPSLPPDNLKLYSSPYLNVCQLLLALMRLRDIRVFPLLDPRARRLERMTRYIRRIDAFLADYPGLMSAHSNLRAVQRVNSALVTHPENLARVSCLGYQTIFFLIGENPPIPELID
jgi:hypothetical protein